MEIAPTCHYIMGGIKVDAETAATCVPGLYAAGECSGGMSGATRLGGNSLSDLLVFGRRAGLSAAAYAAKAPAATIDDSHVTAAEATMLGYLGGDGTEDPYELHAEIQATMQANVGIFRDEAGLGAATSALEALIERARSLGVRETERAYNPGWHLCNDVRNMLVCAESITRAAAIRHESRGAHNRLDHPASSPEWGGKNLVILKGSDGMSVESREVETTSDLQLLVDARRERDSR
jgi:succinate dehydrogenase / fumarate reductase flavoprotein subunit